MKIVLVRPNYPTHIKTPPLGLGYLASYLKANGQDAKIIDGLRDGLDIADLADAILAEKPDLVGITCLTAFYHQAVDLCRRLKSAARQSSPVRNLPIVLGGAHPTALPYEALAESGADFVIRGEGEIALLRLAQTGLPAGPSAITGVYSRADMDASRPADQLAPLVEDLDQLPFPDWEQIDPRTYPKAPHGAIVKKFPVAPIVSSRGCPYECTFCASPLLSSRRIRFRSPANVVAEIEMLVRRFGVREIHFEDDNLTLRRPHVQEICRRLLDRAGAAQSPQGPAENPIRVAWACPNGIRADQVDEELLRLMKDSGCYFLAFGVESANPAILNNIRKRETIGTIERAIAAASRVGISCQAFFIFGLPGETAETIEQTIQFARKSRLARAQFLILDVLPGSQLWSALAGQFQPDWHKNSYKQPEWIPPGLTSEQLLAAQSRAFRKFYSNPVRFFRLLAQVKPGQIKYLVQRLLDFRLLGLGRKKGAAPRG